MKEKEGERRKEQCRRQKGSDLGPQSSRQDMSIRLNDRCKKRFKKILKPLKRKEMVQKFLKNVFKC